MFINRFGKIEIPAGIEVYVTPIDCNSESIQNGTEVRIIKKKTSLYINHSVVKDKFVFGNI